VELTVQNARRLEPPAGRSVVTMMLFGLILIAWLGEWPPTIDTVMYNNTWRSFFVELAPLFTPVPGISLFPWQLLLIALVPFCIGAASGERVHSRELDRAILVSIACIAVTFLWGFARGGSAYYAYYQLWRFLTALLIAYVFMSALRSPRDLVGLGKIVIATGLVRATLCIYVYWTQVHDKIFPLPEYVTDHDDSMLFAAAILTSFIWALFKGGKLTWLTTAVVVSYEVYAIILNTRRIAWVELVLALVLIYFLLGPGPTRSVINRWAKWAAPVVVIYFIAGLGSNSPMFAPVHALTTTGSDYDPSSLTRQEEARNLLHTLVNSGNPIFGTGWGIPYDLVEHYWSNYSANWVLVQYTPHNSLLGLAAFSGLVGIIGIWGVMPVGAYLAARGYRGSTDVIPKVAALVALGCLATYSAHCYGDIGLQSFQGVVMFGLALAVAGKTAAWSAARPLAQSVTARAGPEPRPSWRKGGAPRGRSGSAAKHIVARGGGDVPAGPKRPPPRPLSR
jgi:hypothetical protein